MNKHYILQKTLLFLAFSIFTLPVLGQFTLSGTVTGAEDGEPLAGALVMFKIPNKPVQTDANGKFKVENLPSGTYLVGFSYVGRKTVAKNIVLDRDRSLDIEMELVGYELNELEVTSVYVDDRMPITYTKVERQEIEKLNLAQDLPILLRFQPSIIATSDAGAGVGYTGIRIRGSDATRTNITINGIPLNDAESQGVFWVNMPDFASSVNSLYIQRGVGTSTNGAGAFGASVNIQTEEASDDPFAEINNSYGSFNTWKHNVRFGTGKIGERVSVAGRLSKVTSDGFIDRAFSDLKSFFVTGKYEDVEGGHELEANIFSGQEQTYQAWYGVPEAALEEGNRTLNVVDYENETDNYQQDHYQLIYTKRGLFGLNLNANAALHYTYGRGYFEQYRADDELADYGISPVTLGDTTVENSDLIRRRWLDNDFYGIVYNLNYYGDKLDLHLGGGWNRYEGAHFGEVIWAEFASNSEIRERYYDNDATKTDFNTFLKATYEPVDQLSLFADLQIRQVNYEFLGFDNEGRNVTQDDQLTFFNPKFGARFTSNAHQAYLSYAVAHREPNRNDYTESTPRSRPNPEVLRNVEAGYSYSKGVLNLFGNFYYMNYKDQLVVTGAVNDVGAYTRQNVAKSYRLGVELGAEANWEKVSLKGNLTLSRNKIQEFTEFLDDFDNGGQIQNTYTDTDIAFSPSVVGAAEVTYRPAKGLELSFLNKYVGEQFLDNTQSDTRKIDAYFVSDLRLQYQFKTKPFKNVGLNLLINNIFDIEYEANGYTFGYLAGGATTYENFFFPQAGTNFLLGLQVRF